MKSYSEFVNKFDVKEAIYIEGRSTLQEYYTQYIENTSTKDMAISWELAKWMYTLCANQEVKKILDLGSGFSSVTFRLYKKLEKGIRVYSVDDNKRWVDKTIGFLKNRDLDTTNVLEYKNIQKIKRSVEFDLIFYDLGTMDTRRAEFRNVVEKYLKHKSILIADDLHNNSYKCVLEGVARELGLQVYDLSEVTKDLYGRYSVGITL